MKAKPGIKIVLIGSGNVASQFGKEFFRKGHSIVQVYSPTINHAKALARQLKSKATSSLKDLNQEADFYLLSVKDDVITDVVSQLQFQPKFIVHTSGTTSMDCFKQKFDNYGVCYPLQTFSIQKKIDFSEIPLFLEANSKSNLSQLSKVAGILSAKLYTANSQKRKALHVAAVFACNFTNHMYAIAAELLKKEKLPFEVLMPLIKETSEKIKFASPKQMQTGPAIRGDKKIIKSHLDFLKQEKGYKKIYTLVSQSISELGN